MAYLGHGSAQEILDRRERLCQWVLANENEASDFLLDMFPPKKYMGRNHSEYCKVTDWEGFKEYIGHGSEEERRLRYISLRKVGKFLSASSI